jgi:hypothetical protein
VPDRRGDPALVDRRTAEPDQAGQLGLVRALVEQVDEGGYPLAAPQHPLVDDFG